MREISPLRQTAKDRLKSRISQNRKTILMDKNKVTLLVFLVEVKTSNGKTWSRGTNSRLPFSVNVTFNLLNSTSPQTFSKSALTFIPKMPDSFEENLQFLS